ncbi:MAG: TRAP transporter small permease subunit [Deltaproteobacteria bacterium]|nr:TRAP transporter small permease subunit [Deltaproteobacteria bacterium]
MGFVDSLNEWIGRIFGMIIIPIVLIAVYEVICRRFLNSPTIWSFEVLKQLFGLYFMMLAAYGLLHKAHISIDVFTMRLSKKKRAIIDIICYIIFYFPFCLITIKYSYVFAAVSWVSKERSWSVFGPVLYPIKTVIFIGFTLLLLQGISEFIKDIYVVRSKEL